MIRNFFSTQTFNHFFNGTCFNKTVLENLINNICSDYKYYKDRVFENQKVAILNGLDVYEMRSIFQIMMYMSELDKV